MKISKTLRRFCLPFYATEVLLFERVEFGFANQAEHETIDRDVVRLHQLAESFVLGFLVGV